MQALFVIRTLNHIICLPLFNIYNWFISQNPDFFFISQNPVFFSFHKIQIYRLATSFSDSENSPLECTLFLLSERSITYVYLCLIFTIGSFRKIQIFLLICNKQYVAAIGSFRKIQIFFFSFRKIQIL